MSSRANPLVATWQPPAAAQVAAALPGTVGPPGVGGEVARVAQPAAAAVVADRGDRRAGGREPVGRLAIAR